MTIAVAPRRTGRGLGRLLLAELDDARGRRGAAHVMLEVRADNAPRSRLYERSGFEPCSSTRRRYYQPGDVDALVMRKPLLERGADHE